MRSGIILTLVSALLMLGACGVTSGGPSPLSPSARATQTAVAATTQTAMAAQSTQTAQPVTVSVSAQQQGVLSQRDSTLLITYLVTNHTQAPINIAGNCHVPAYTLQYLDAAGHVVLRSPDVVGCPIQSPYKDWGAPIPPGATNPGPFSPIADSFRNSVAGGGGGLLIQPGTYTLEVTVNLWHQGTIEQYENDTSGVYAHGTATGQTMVTLR